MKAYKTIILIALILITNSCCKDDDLQGDSGSFSEYFTCKINGVEFDTQGTFYCLDKAFYFYNAGDGGLPDSYMLIYGRNCVESKSVAIRLSGMQYQTGYLNFLEPTFADSCRPFYKHNIQGQEGEMYENLISGSMNITTFTPRDSVTEILGKIEGTFEFSVANEENDSIIHVTDGAFRFKVPNIW